MICIEYAMGDLVMKFSANRLSVLSGLEDSPYPGSKSSLLLLWFLHCLGSKAALLLIVMAAKLH